MTRLSSTLEVLARLQHSCSCPRCRQHPTSLSESRTKPVDREDDQQCANAKNDGALQEHLTELHHKDSNVTDETSHHSTGCAACLDKEVSVRRIRPPDRSEIPVLGKKRTECSRCRCFRQLQTTLGLHANAQTDSRRAISHVSGGPAY